MKKPLITICVKWVISISLISILMQTVGCYQPQKAELSSPDDIAAFQKAGPIRPTIDVDKLTQSQLYTGPYRVVAGDILDVQIPAVLQNITAEPLIISAANRAVGARVRQDGKINLPLVGLIGVAGKTLSEIEMQIVSSYYPDYSQRPPAVLVTVGAYNTQSVAITGNVQMPGIYELRHDRMSVVSLIMEAGGFIQEGASVIRITRSDSENSPNPENIDSDLIMTATVVDESVRVSGDLSDKNSQFKLVFVQTEAPGTFGELVVMNGETVVLVERLDIASNIQRQAALEKLEQANPEISSQEIGQKLYVLAKKFQPDAIKSVSSAADVQGFSENLNREHNRNNAIVCDSENGLMELLSEPAADNVDSEQSNPNLIVMPVKGLNIPFTDVQLFDGDRVEVERMEPQEFVVIGLVNRPGAFPFRPGVTYTLLQALGHAGGVDDLTDPKYVSVYREGPEEQVIAATFRIQGVLPESAANIQIKPGDVVAVEHTPRTRRNLLLSEIFRFNVGVYVRPEDF